MLQLLASEDEPLGLMQVATALDLPKGTVHGLLRTLSEVGFVTQDSTSGRYQVSPDLYRLGTPRLDLHELRARALNWTDALAARAEEAVAVAAFRDSAAVVAHYVFGGERNRPTHGEHDRLARDRERGITVGTRLPLHADALGKVLLAFDPGATRSLVGKPLISLTLARSPIESRCNVSSRWCATVVGRPMSKSRNLAAQASPHRSETAAAMWSPPSALTVLFADSATTGFAHRSILLPAYSRRHGPSLANSATVPSDDCPLRCGPRPRHDVD